MTIPHTICASPTTPPPPSGEAPRPFTAVHATPMRNVLLTALGDEALSGLMVGSRRMAFGSRTTVRLPGEVQDLVLFPETGFLSIQSLGEDGVTSEVGLAAAGDAVGLLEAISGHASPFGCLAVLPTTAWAVPSAALRSLMFDNRAAARPLWRWLGTAQDAAHSGIACASRHRGRARLADRLLDYRRAAEVDRLRVTQEDLAGALGFTRTSVTALLTELAALKSIRCGRGWIEVLDPERLRGVACGCRAQAAGFVPL
jgi:CRP-like cAMP-binding protein